MWCVGRLRRKGSEWWNEVVGWAVAEKRRAFEEWLQRRDRVTYDREWLWNGQFKLQKEWWTGNGESNFGMISSIFEGNKKMFWKEVKWARKGEQARDEMVNGCKWSNIAWCCWGQEELGRVFWIGTECGRCQGGKYQCSWQLADGGVGRFEWKSNIMRGIKGGSEWNEIW